MGDSSNSTTNYTENTNQQFANYGDGSQILVGDDSNVHIESLADDVAIAAIEEAGIFAETAAAMNEKMQANNLQFADNALRDTYAFADKTVQGSLQFADNAMSDSANLASGVMRNTALMARNSMQFADNAMQDSVTFISEMLGKSQESINEVVSSSANQSGRLAKSVIGMASEIKTGSSNNTKMMLNVVTLIGVGGLLLVLVKKK